MSNKRREQVTLAVKRIKAFYRIGKGVRVKTTHKESYGLGEVENEAEKHDMNPDTLRKARVFADRDRGYTKKEVEELCMIIKEVQIEQDGSIFGRTHVIRLLSVPKAQRADVQNMAINNGWSVGELETYIASNFGSRRDGGRKRRVPSDPVGLLVQLERLCEGWRRWSDTVTGDQKKALPRRKSKVEVLPADLHKSVIAATRAVSNLHEQVNRELQSRRPDRSVRKRFRDEESTK